MDFVWESIVMVLTGVILLRFAGRKSISQLTVPTTVVMISIGSIIIQPIIENSIWKTIVSAAIFIAVLVLLEYLELKFDFAEKLITGKSIMVIQNGILVEENLKKLRFTVDKLEVRLRQAGIKSISDVKMATLEPNGQLGYELNYSAQPLTVGEFKKMMALINPKANEITPEETFNIFNETQANKHVLPIKDELK